MSTEQISDNEVSPYEYKFNFGKHRGKSLALLIQDDPKYLIWLSKQKWIKDDAKEAIAKVLDNITIDFGRHTGKSIGYIRVNDPSYYKWLFE